MNVGRMQEEMRRAKIELRTARNAQTEAKRALTAFNKAQLSTDKLAAKAHVKIYRLHERLTAIVGVEDEFEQLPLWLKTQLRIAYNEINAIYCICSDYVRGTRVDVEFDNKILDAAVTNAKRSIKDLRKFVTAANRRHAC